MHPTTQQKQKKVPSNHRSGFTMIEAIVSLAIFTVIVGAIVVFQRSVIANTKVLQGSLTSQMQVRNALESFVTEVRSATQSAGGAYPIEVAATSSFVFYANVDGDAAIERVRYSLATTSIIKGITKPTGTIYNLANETANNLVVSIRITASTTIFDYFDRNYNGTSSSTPLATPINIPDVRLVKMSLPVDPNAARSPIYQTYSTQAMLRNLKDNY